MSNEAEPPTSAQPQRRGPGAPLAADRDPDSLCTAMRSDGVTPCMRFKVTGSTVCQTHGAHKAPRARSAIMTVAEKNGIVLPEVKPKDFPRIAAEVISWNLQQFAELGTELEKLRLLHDPVTHARAYADIFGLLDQMGRTIATLTKAAAALPPVPDEPPTSPARAQIMDALEGIASRLSTGNACGCCGAPLPVAGSVETDSAPSDGPDAAVAVVVPLAPGEGSGGAVVVSPEGDLL